MENKMVTETLSGLEKLKQKYNIPKIEAEPSAQTYRTFDRQTFDSSKKRLERLSKEPMGDTEKSRADIYSEVAGIQLELANLAEEYGKLNVDFKNTLGKYRLFKFGDALSYYTYILTGQKKKAINVKQEAIKGNVESIEILVKRMAEVLQEQHQKAIKGKERAQKIHLENVTRLKTLDDKLIENLRGGVYTNVDLTEAEREVQKLEQDLKEVISEYNEYESKLNTAKAAGNFDEVKKIATDIDGILQIKHGILDGKLGADGLVSEVRRDLLDKAEGVQSAKGAIAATEVNYRVLNGLIDFFNELVIKYHHAREDMIPVFMEQGAITAIAMGGAELKKTLIEVADISGRLMNVNAELAMQLLADSFELLKTPIYDVKKMRALEEKIKAATDKLNEAKKEWATNQQKLEDIKSNPHYAVVQ